MPLEIRANRLLCPLRAVATTQAAWMWRAA